MDMPGRGFHSQRGIDFDAVVNDGDGPVLRHDNHNDTVVFSCETQGRVVPCPPCHVLSLDCLAVKQAPESPETDVCQDVKGTVYLDEGFCKVKVVSTFLRLRQGSRMWPDKFTGSWIQINHQGAAVLPAFGRVNDVGNGFKKI